MVAIVRYQLATLLYSQRYLPPVLIYVALVAVLYSEPTAPLSPEYAVSAGVMTAVACWLTIVTVSAEAPAQRLITVSHARRPGRLVIGVALVVLACCLALTVATLGWSLVLHRGGRGGRGAEVIIGGLVHIAGALAGIAVGLPCSRLLVDGIGRTLILSTAGLSVLVLSPWVPVLHAALRALSGITAPGPRPAVLSLIAATALLTISCVVVNIAERRRR